MLCLACSCITLSSNAELITVPLANGLSITVSTGSVTTQNLQDLKNNPLATNVTMGDDSNVKIPLGFSFPFYGQQFTESWMYSNGAVNFKSGGAPGGFCCSGINLTTLRDTNYNYSIVPLWTDLIALQGGSHYTLGTSTSRTYGWYGVSEYADTNKRSSYELTIESTGKINTVFSGAHVSAHQVTSGMIGDISKGEYYQYYNGGNLVTGAFSWSTNSTGAVYDPCKENPLSSATCSGFSSALKNLNPSTNNTATVTANTVDIPEATQAGLLPAPQQDFQTAGPQLQNGPQIGPLLTPGAPLPQQQAAQSSSTTSTPGSPANSPQEKASTGTPNLGFALSLIAKNSDREKSITQQVVTQAESQAQAAGDRAQQIGASVSSAAVAASTTSSDTAFSGGGIQVSGSGSRSNTVVNVTAQQPISTLSQNIQGFNAVGSNQQSSMLQLLIPTTLEQIQSQQNYAIFATQEVRQQESEVLNQQISFLTDLNNPIKQILDAQQFQQTVEDQPQQAQRRDVAPNELALGVNLAQMAIQPQGYGSYTSFVLRDAQFYEIKEVYKNQAVVDNVRVLRGLGSDQKHKDLVNLQYK